MLEAGGQSQVGQLRWLLALLAMLAGLLAPNAPVGAEDLAASATYDDRVLPALDLLDESGATSELRPLLEARRIAIQFVPMGSGIYARYSVSRRIIEIDSRWTDADPATLAAVIAHEATHAQDAVTGYLSSGGASACIDSEIRAFRTSALFWLDIYGSGGKPNPADELERQLNLIADRQLHDPVGLESVVAETYTSQCNH